MLAVSAVREFSSAWFWGGRASEKQESNQHQPAAGQKQGDSNIGLDASLEPVRQRRRLRLRFHLRQDGLSRLLKIFVRIDGGHLLFRRLKGLSEGDQFQPAQQIRLLADEVYLHLVLLGEVFDFFVFRRDLGKGLPIAVIGG